MSALDISDAAVARALDGLRTGRGADDAEVYAAAVWSVLAEPGDAVAGRLIALHGAAAGVERMVSGGAAAQTGLSASELAAGRARWMPRLQPQAVAAAFDRARRAGARLIAPGDAEWPRGLGDLGDHAPPVLWVRGALAQHPPADWHVAELEVAL